VNPDTGKTYDDIVPVIKAMPDLSDAHKQAIFEGNARKLFKLS
jgi:hypothetical protein